MRDDTVRIESESLSGTGNKRHGILMKGVRNIMESPDLMIHAAVEETLRRDIATLAHDIGERNTRCPDQLHRAQAFIEKAFSQSGLAVRRQIYSVDGVECANVIAEIGSSRDRRETVIFGAHYDTVDGSPGANDNATGIAALLALSRRLNGHRLGRRLRFVAFVNEERPYLRTPAMGSYVYASQCRRERDPVVAMISLETIGYYPGIDPPDAQSTRLSVFSRFGRFLAVVGNWRSRRLVDRVTTSLRAAEDFPVRDFRLPGALPGVSSSDHWAFWQHGYPACMLTDTAPFRYPFYHRAADTPDKLSYRTLSHVVTALEHVAVELASPRRRCATIYA